MIRSFITLTLSAFFVSAAFAGTTTVVETRSVPLSSTVAAVGDHCTNNSYLGLYDQYSYASNFSYVAKEITRQYLVSVVTTTTWTGKKQVIETMIPDSITVVENNAQYIAGESGLNFYTTADGCESKRQMYKSSIGKSIR
jgi:hypothetical protein